MRLINALHVFLLLLKTYWRCIVLFGVPLALLPLALQKNDAWKCAFIIILVSIYWVTEVVDITVTAFLPIILFPMFSIIPSAQIASCYMKDITILLMGGLIVAQCVEQQNLHRRMALRVLMIAGPAPILQYMGFMLSTWFLSMWISNTATTAMMVTIAVAVINEIKEIEEKENAANNQENTEEVNLKKLNTHLYSKGLLIGIAYAAASGGIVTITGTGPNLVLYGYVVERYGDKFNFNFGTFILFTLPISIICLLFTWILLCLRFVGFRNIFCIKRSELRDKRVREIIYNQYNELGTIKFGECAALFLFLVLVALWVLREPGIPLWSSLFMKEVNGKTIKFWADSTSGILVVFIMFIFPGSNPFKKNSDSKKLLNWTLVQKKFPWMLIFLFGAGFTLALGCQESGLSTVIGNTFYKLKNFSLFVLLYLMCQGTSLVTEITSNTATSTILVPIVFNIAECIQIHPLLPGVACALCCSFAFCLPVATPPNSIIFSTRRIKVIDLVSCGVILNMFCVMVVAVISYFYCNTIFYTNTFPQWLIKNCTELN